jgi:K+-transporting ATPase ATPase C chain
MKTLIISLKIFLFFTVLTGIVYPLFVTGIALLLYPAKANGSLVLKNNQVIGSELIGQQFDTSIYFSSRPSAVLYNPLPSGGSNLGLTNEKLNILVAERRHRFSTSNSLDSLAVIPSEMLFASASGLDPHISPEAAFLQLDRVAAARHFNARQHQKLLQCVVALSETPQFLCLGQARINVLLLNLETDKIQ